jgi:hypothetical protein
VEVLAFFAVFFALLLGVGLHNWAADGSAVDEPPWPLSDLPMTSDDRLLLMEGTVAMTRDTPPAGTRMR